MGFAWAVRIPTDQYDEYIHTGVLHIPTDANFYLIWHQKPCMEYKIIEISKYGSPEKKFRLLEIEVNKAIAEGWIPQGGPSLENKQNLVIQAMVRN